MLKIKNIIIIGSGPSGYTAAIYTSRANLKPLLITGNNEGGQIIKSNNIENWPGNKNNFSGYKLMSNMKKQAIKFKTKIIHDKVIKIKKIKKYYKIITYNKKIFYSWAIIIATGTIPKKIKIKKNNFLYNKIISNCAICDGFLYKNKIVTIIGGGNSAIEESLYLSQIAKKVNIIHRKNKFTAEKILINKLKKNKKIKLYKNYILKNLNIKNNILKNIIIKSITNKKKIKINTDGLFILIGQLPNTKFLNNFIKLDKKGYIIISYKNNKYSYMTNKKGIFASGDIISNQYKQAIIASSSGCIAAIEVQKYLNTIKIKND